MTILEKFRKDHPTTILSDEEIALYRCPSLFYDIPDITGCDGFNQDRCVRCWQREFKED